MDISLFESVGLTKTEAKIYLALIDSGSSLAGTISQKSGIHRRSVYDALERLIEKGLVSFMTKNNRKWFKAAHPKRILQMLDEKKESIKDSVHELEARMSFTKDKEETTFFKGRQALKTVFDDQIEVGKEILVLGASASANETVKYYFPHYDNRRKKLKIKTRIIFNEWARNDEYVKTIPLAEKKFLPDKYSNPVAINIYGDRVAMVIWTEEPAAILIKNKEVAEGSKKYFELMWSIAKR